MKRPPFADDAVGEHFPALGPSPIRARAAFRCKAENPLKVPAGEIRAIAVHEAYEAVKQVKFGWP